MSHNSVSFSDPLTLTLDVVGPKANPSRGEPVESVKVLFEDAQIEAGVWECTPGTFPSRRDGFREAVTIIAGSGTLRDADGNESPFAAGTALAIPEGWSGEWDIVETTRKIYVVSYTEPRS